MVWSMKKISLRRHGYPNGIDAWIWQCFIFESLKTALFDCGQKTSLLSCQQFSAWHLDRCLQTTNVHFWLWKRVDTQLHSTAIRKSFFWWMSSRNFGKGSSVGTVWNSTVWASFESTECKFEFLWPLSCPRKVFYYSFFTRLFLQKLTWISNVICLQHEFPGTKFIVFYYLNAQKVDIFEVISAFISINNHEF